MSNTVTEMYRKADQKLLCSCLTRKDVRRFTEKLVRRTQPWLPEEEVAIAMEALMRVGHEKYKKSLQKNKLDQIKRTLRNFLKRCGCKDEVWDERFRTCKCEETCRGTQVSLFGLVAINRSFRLKLRHLDRGRYGRLEIEAPAVSNLGIPQGTSRKTPPRLVVPKNQAKEDVKQVKEWLCIVGLKKRTGNIENVKLEEINVDELLKGFEIIESMEMEVPPGEEETRRKEHERSLNKDENVLHCPRCVQNSAKRQCHATVFKQLKEKHLSRHRKLLADEIGVDALQAQINEQKLNSLEISLKQKHQARRVTLSRKFLTDEEGVDAWEAQLDFLRLGAQNFSDFLMAFANRKRKGDAIDMLEEIRMKHVRKLKEELRRLDDHFKLIKNKH